MTTKLQDMDNTRYKVIPRVLLFIFNYSNQVLLIKGNKTKKIWSGKFNGLGGHVERGEGLLEAAKRELAEESGIVNCDLKFIGNIMIDQSPRIGVCLFIFYGYSEEVKLTQSEEGFVQWINIIDLDKIPGTPDLLFLIQKIQKSIARNELFYGKYVLTNNKQLRIVI